MGLFNSPEKRMLEMQKQQIDNQAYSNNMGVVQQMNDQASVAYDPQVSAMLLDNDARMLNWIDDFDKNVRRLDESERGMIEPFGFEQLGFLDGKSGQVGACASFAQTLRAIKLHMQKYGVDDSGKRLFNDLAGAYQITLLLSRATGKPQQLAKSQIIRSTGEVFQYNNPKDRKGDKLFGLF
jgi:hypothetical protein